MVYASASGLFSFAWLAKIGSIDRYMDEKIADRYVVPLSKNFTLEVRSPE
jgi:hypothetical protein